jgi:Flp pilus assembly pilin Flp
MGTSARGQGLVEYGLILGGIAVVAIVTLVFFGDVVAQVLDLIGNAIDQATS